MRCAPFVSMLAVLALFACSNDAVQAPALKESQVIIVSATSAPLVSRGEVRSLVAVVIDPSGEYVNSPEVVWTSSAPTVATVTGNSAIGTVSAVDDGTATITATSRGARQSVTITVRRVMTSVVLQNDD